MSYTISYTDQANNGTIIVEDGTINTETTLQFPGRNTSAYGKVVATNFLQLLENFASATEPARPTEGQLWYDTTPSVEQLKVYDGTQWVPAGGLNKGTSEPNVTSSQRGDLWVDTDNQQLYLNSGSGWVLVGPTFSDGLSTGVTPLTVTGTDNQQYTIVQVEVNAQPIALISTNAFSPKTTIPGFEAGLKPGFNLSTRNITGSGVAKYYGTAEKAENLVVNNVTVPAGNFLRSDTTSTTLFPLSVQNNTGLTIGTDAALNVAVEGQAGIIQQNIEGSSIDLRTRSQGRTRTVLRVDASQRVGVNTQAPDEALDVVGNIQTDSSIFVDGTIESSTIGTGSIITKGGIGVAKSVNVGGDLQVLSLTTLANTIPDGNNTRNLGAPASKWQNIYATTFIGNLTGNVNGTVSGVAGSANKLTSGSTFRITGDVTADDVVFDGQTGGTLKIFNTAISNAIVSSKELTNVTQVDDEILINRTTGNQGLYRTSRRTLLSAVPTNPPGVILPYAGISAPTGWLLCDGTEYRISEYSLLFQIIGYAFGARTTVATGFFKVPDMRGRLPLGADNMGGVSANVVTADYADGIGQIGGSEFKTVNVENLPEHKHNLSGDSGDQYFALRDVSGTPRDNEAIVYDAPTGLGNGQALPNSGAIISENEVGQPLNTMDPTLTFNYIIYTGRTIT
jgi:microcystin-dependent protein/cytoskeletal protein CcmA (bactofilin family)